MNRSLEQARRPRSRFNVWFAGVALATIATTWATTLQAQEVLPRPEPPFAGTTNRTLQGSKPSYPQSVHAPAASDETVSELGLPGLRLM